ncbi:MAG: hypothetical protein AAB691_04490 [Patescibacteria group bacterium]
MFKIFVDKKETVTILAEKVADAPYDVITLVVPRGSKLGEGNHLHLLKKHAEEAGKTLIIESIDEHILGLAEKQGLERIHPLFEGAKKREMLSDIRPRHHVKKAEEAEEEVEGEVEEEREEKVAEKPRRRFMKLRARFHSKKKEEIAIGEGEDEEVEESEESISFEPEPKRRRYTWIIVLGLIVFGVGLWGGSRALGRADISITQKKTPWQSSVVIVADKSPAAARAGGVIVPASLFTEKKNTVQFFKASGKKQTTQKATAKVTLYNAYDSSPQTLVATTRLATPDGKIFRLDNKITIPGAKLDNGKITPVGIDTTVTADQAGSDYNVGPFDKMTVVGFKGTPRYDGFYAVMKEKAKGGVIGEAPYPTDEDIAKAEEKTKSILQSSLDIDIRRRVPEELKILKEASTVQISKLAVDKAVDEQGNFNVQGDGQLSVIAFKEEDVKRVFESMMKETNADQVFKTVTLTYSNAQPDFVNGKMSVGVKSEAVLVSPLDEKTLGGQLAGKSLSEAQAILSNLPGLEQAKIGIWPPWLWRVPGNSAHITLIVN